MVLTKKNSLIAVLGIITFFYISVSNSAPLDISGTYRCNGNDPTLDPPGYKEDIVLTKNADTYKAEIYTINGAIPYFLGTAIVNKDINNAFSLLFWNPIKPDRKGSELFFIKPDRSLSGQFAYANTNNIGNETCIKIPAR